MEVHSYLEQVEKSRTNHRSSTDAVTYWAVLADVVGTGVVWFARLSIQKEDRFVSDGRTN